MRLRPHFYVIYHLPQAGDGRAMDVKTACCGAGEGSPDCAYLLNKINMLNVKRLGRALVPGERQKINLLSRRSFDRGVNARPDTISHQYLRRFCDFFLECGYRRLGEGQLMLQEH